MTKINPNSNEALIVVDIQNDFCEGGALEVPDASKIIDKSNKLINIFDQVILTQDWHPYNHISFASQHKGKKFIELGDYAVKMYKSLNFSLRSSFAKSIPSSL